MCYQIPGSITKSGKPIIGGLDIDRQDFAFAALIYPKVAKPKAAPKRKAKAKSKAKAVRKSKVKHRSGRRRQIPTLLSEKIRRAQNAQRSTIRDVSCAIESRGPRSVCITTCITKFDYISKMRGPRCATRGPSDATRHP
jgi:hypothetical protein